MESYNDYDGYLELRHSKEFIKLEKQNSKKVDDLRKEFNKEAGWDEDFVYEDDEEE